jgi:hypothetical protein
LSCWAVLGFSLGCYAPLYVPGALLSAPECDAGQEGSTVATRRVGCLDVRMALACNHVVAQNRPLVAFTFGNRCDAPVAIDFTRVRVTAHDGDAGDEPMTAFDPRGEIHAALLGAHARGREVVAYDPASEDRSVASLCVDVSSLVEGGDAVPPACLARPEGACKASP